MCGFYIIYLKKNVRRREKESICLEDFVDNRRDNAHTCWTVGGGKIISLSVGCETAFCSDEGTNDCCGITTDGVPSENGAGCSGGGMSIWLCSGGGSAPLG